MTHMKLRFPFQKRRRARHRDDPSEVFRTFVHVLAQMHAHARTPGQANLAAHREKS